MNLNQTVPFDHENGIMDPVDDIPSSAAGKEMQSLIAQYEMFEISLLRLEMELEYEVALGVSLRSQCFLNLTHRKHRLLEQHLTRTKNHL